MTYNKVGMESRISTILIMTMSTLPPTYPAIPPYKTPIIKQIKALAKAIDREIRPPYITLTKISLPSLSVPNGWSKLGMAFFRVMFWSSNPYLDKIGTNIAITTMMTRKISPIIANLFFLYRSQTSLKNVFDSMAMNSEFFSSSGSFSNIFSFNSMFIKHLTTYLL